MRHQHVIVFGSINMDLITKTHRLPVAGETLLGQSFFTVPGGKGANQAVTLARLGVSTTMVGRVGKDRFGEVLLTSLQSAGVSTNDVLLDESNSSGIAVITVDDRSENQIIIIPGVNGQVNEWDVERLTHQLAGAAALLLQLEVPIAAVQLAAQVAQKAGVRVILDPAPVFDLPIELYPLVDILTPNAIEVEQLVGFRVEDPETAAQAAHLLQQRGVNTVIVKLGAQGVCCASSDETFFMPAIAVDAVDTVAARDAFNGGLAAALAEGLSIRQAVVWGVAAGALCATKPGALSSLPDRATFNAFLSKHGYA